MQIAINQENLDKIKQAPALNKYEFHYYISTKKKEGKQKCVTEAEKAGQQASEAVGPPGNMTNYKRNYLDKRQQQRQQRRLHATPESPQSTMVRE